MFKHVVIACSATLLLLAGTGLAASGHSSQEAQRRQQELRLKHQGVDLANQIDQQTLARGSGSGASGTTGSGATGDAGAGGQGYGTRMNGGMR
jgi:hypothetical protein